MQVSNYDMFSGLVQFVNNRNYINLGANDNELTTSITNPGLELANDRLGALVSEQNQNYSDARSNAIESGSAAFASEDIQSRVSDLRELATQAKDEALSDEERAGVVENFNAQRNELNERFDSLTERSNGDSAEQRDIRESFSALQNEASFINEIDISDSESLEANEEQFAQFQESAQNQRDGLVENREDSLANAEAIRNDTDEIDRARDQIASLEQASTQAQEIQQQISQSGAFVTQSQANISQAFAVSLLT